MVIERAEWDDGANVNECGGVEQHINNVRELGIFGSFVEEAIPSKGGSASKR